MTLSSLHQREGCLAGQLSHFIAYVHLSGRHTGVAHSVRQAQAFPHPPSPRGTGGAEAPGLGLGPCPPFCVDVF
jgi:hypothetical protein